MQGKITLLLLCVALFAKAQNYSVAEPRMRVNRTASLTLSTSWQTLAFNGTSTLNFNTYGMNPATGTQMVSYNTTSNVFRVYGEYDKNILVQLFFNTTTTAIAVGTTMQYRFIIPNGGGAGVDTYFPFPENGGYGEIASVGLATVGMNSISSPLAVYANSAVRTNGFYIQVRLSNTVTLGSSTINSAACVITSRY